MITQQTIQQILSRIDIIEIVGGFVRLKKRGANYLGLCPFHGEKTPSFTVSPAKEIYKCFGCGRSGNTISFLMEHEKYSYVEALRWLAAKYNVEVEETESSPEVKLQQQVADSLYIINSFAQKYFSQQLLESEEGQNVGLSYLEERGFNEAIIKKFQLGYCLQERDAFAKAALGAQYNLEYLQKSGLVVVRDERPVDNYRGRIIFPVQNQSGKIIGFGARIIGKNDRAPKYINTPENEIYIKSKILYGLYFARQAIDKNDECLLVEGYTDVISLHQAGIENVVASGGTSLTQDQLRLIKKYTNNLTIIYDGDAAGVKAALRGLDMALEEGLNVKLVLIPDKEDPDSYVHKVGTAKFNEFVKSHKKDFILFQLETNLKEIGSDSQKKAALVNQIAESISKINKLQDFTRQQDYIRQCSQILQIEEGGLNALVNNFIREKVTKEENKRAADPNVITEVSEPMEGPTDFSNEAFSMLHQDKLQEQAVVRSLLEHGAKPWDEHQTIADYIFESKIDDDLFEDKVLLKIMDAYKAKYQNRENPTIKDFAYSEDLEIATTTITLTNFPYILSENWNREASSSGTNKLIWSLPYETFMKDVIKHGNVNPEIFNKETADSYKEFVETVLGYIKLRKIRKMILINQSDMQQTHSESEMQTLLNTHIYLKQEQMKLGNNKGIVNYPF